MKERVDRLKTYLEENKSRFEGFFVTKAENRAYLSGFTGSFGYLLLTAQDQILFTDGRYTEQAAGQAPDWKVVRLQRPFEQNVVTELERLKVARLGFEAENLSFGDYQYWSEALPGVEWIPTQGVVAHQRRLKDPEEVKLVREAVEIACKAFDDLLGVLKPGMTEREAASQLEYQMRRHGADSLAFETIVASGERGALPHGRATGKTIQAGELVTFDFGARYQGYNSDITRTVSIGKPTARQREIYDLVRQAQAAGCEGVRPGIECNKVDAIPRQIFERAGVLGYYLHSTGHNLGREVHEYPMLTPPDASLVEEGMVLTVEPGLYISGWGGVRIEDDLLVTASGSEILPRLSKELIIV